MQELLARWERSCTSSRMLRFVDINLRGTGRVMFQNHPLTGALFLAAIGWGSWSAGVPEVFIGGLLGLVVSTLTARWLHVDPQRRAAGLYSYNGILVGLALPTFLASAPLLWAYVVLGAAVSVVAMLATVNVAKAWSVSALTFPFVLTTWLLLLATYAFAGLDGSALPFSGEVVAIDPSASNPLDLAGFVRGVFRSRWAVVTASSAPQLFYRPSPRVVMYAALGTVFTVVAQGAMNVALTPLGLPKLTAPFVLASWLFLLPRQHFDEGSASA